MRLNLYIAVRNLFLLPCSRLGNKFHWKEYYLPTTLQLNSSLEVLLAPVGFCNVRETIKLGLQEALVNAVRHGNQGDPNKALRVRFIITPRWVVWQIQDEGIGLPIEARKFNLPSHVDANSGRGLFMIHQCFDDVRWSIKGNRLQVALKRKSMN